MEDVSTGRTWGFMRDQQVNCDDCEYKATSTYDLENHVKLKHNVKQFFFFFFSWKLCDFDSEHVGKLKFL